MIPLPLDLHDLQAFMAARAIPGEILRLSAPTPTVETASQAAGVRAEQIVKSILFLVNAQPVLAIACGTAYVERRAIAARFGVGRKRVKLASPEEVLAISGYEVGAMPPFGHRQPLRTLLDRRVLDLPVVYAGGGAENALVRLDPRDIARITNAEVLDLTAIPHQEEIPCQQHPASPCPASPHHAKPPRPNNRPANGTAPKPAHSARPGG